jgi:anti-anti-sigma regulatory factor
VLRRFVLCVLFRQCVQIVDDFLFCSLTASTHIDATAVSALKIMFAKYQSRNVRLLFSNVRPPMRDAIHHVRRFLILCST